MKDKLKNINWKNVGWRSLQAFIVAILNTPLWVMIIGNVVGSTKWYQLEDGEVIGEKTDFWFSDLDMSHKAIIIGFIVVGIILSFALIKFLYIQKRDDKRMEKQTKELKNDRREQKDIDKYI